MIYIDRKYTLLIANKLRNFKQRRTDLFSFSCPVCGDSQKKSTKARGYIYRKAEKYFFMCHNCNFSTTFSKFLERIDPEQHKAYVYENYALKHTEKPVEPSTVNTQVHPSPSLFDRYKRLSDFENFSINNLPDGHYAKEYIRNRLIPQEFWNEILFVEKFHNWLNENFPDHTNDKIPNDPRIVLFYTDKNCNITNIAGRALENGEYKLRYVTIKIRDEKKVFGLHRLNIKEPVYVCEGQFDSLFINNAVATGDSDLESLAFYLQKEYNIEKVVLLFDNTPRNREIVKGMERACFNYDIVVMPYSEDTKDINEMIQSGIFKEDLNLLIKKYIKPKGLDAMLAIKEWKKC